MSADRHDVVVGVLVQAGRVLLCHRSSTRRWYPNVWDVPGGHIEANESPADALKRELSEELGIHARLRSSEPFRTLDPKPDLRLRVWIITDWEGDIQNCAPDEHDDIEWFAADQLQHLDLADDLLTELIVEALDAPPHATTSRTPVGFAVRRHLTVIFVESDMAEVAQLRHEWDPTMAAGVPPHLTLVYPEEVSDFDLLIERARVEIPRTPKFHIHLGSTTVLDDGAGGVFVSVHDETGTLALLRDRLLQAQRTPIRYQPHVTIAHPRTTNAGTRCWNQLNGWSANSGTTIAEVAFTHTDSANGMQTIETFHLA